MYMLCVRFGHNKLWCGKVKESIRTTTSHNEWGDNEKTMVAHAQVEDRPCQVVQKNKKKSQEKGGRRSLDGKRFNE